MNEDKPVERKICFEVVSVFEHFIVTFSSEVDDVMEQSVFFGMQRLVSTNLTIVNAGRNVSSGGMNN